MVNYSKLKVDELKEFLVLGGMTVASLEGLGKKELVKLHKETKTSLLSKWFN